MLRLWALVGLICHFNCETLMGAPAVTINGCNRKNGLKEAVCCENKLYPGEGRICGGQAYNPEEATCCIVEDGDIKTAVTVGLSAQVSSCCGLKAYDELNEMCCQSNVVAKPALNAKCCGQNAINKDTELCCGPNKTILHRQSRDHLCCGHHQFNSKRECCCVMKNSLEIRPRGSSCCVEESAPCGLKTYNTLEELCCELTVVAKHAPNAQCCDQRAFNKDTELCCGPKGDKKILSRQSRDHLCCGHHQFNEKTECCCVMKNSLEIRPRGSSCCVEEPAPCGLKTYNTLEELCCELTVVAKHAPNAQCCDQRAFNKDTELCCGPKGDKKILSRQSRDHLCCGHHQFNEKTECCCVMKNSLEIRPRGSSCCVEEPAPCGLKTYNTLEELCCELTVVAKHAPNAQCCDQRAFNKDTELCCGPKGNKTILHRGSMDHLCCGHHQFNSKRECCCVMKNSLEIRPRGSSCCVEESGVQQQKPTSELSCTEPTTSLCGSTCYNPRNFLCCERNLGRSQRICTPGQYAEVPTVYNPETHICCDGNLSERKPWGIQHCCGTGAYRPHAEICCSGRRHLKTENTHCCGVKAYNIKDPQKKCCAGTLHNLTLPGYDARCCGSILETPQTTVCCSSEDKEVLYPAKTGFGCCGHRYYNASLWSCCAENLSPAHQPGRRQSQRIIEVKLLSVNNLNETHLCNEMHIGTLESVGPNSAEFRSVLKIHGRTATVTPLASPLILETPDRCRFPKLIPGKFYFFDKVHVFTDFNHDSILLSLHSLISKCYHP